MCIYDVLKKCSRESVCTPSVYSITTPLHYLSIFFRVNVAEKNKKILAKLERREESCFKGPINVNAFCLICAHYQFIQLTGVLHAVYT